MDTEEREQLRRDDCRAIVLQYLASRPAIAQSAGVIADVLRTRGHDFDAKEVRDACLYFKDHGHTEQLFKPGQNTPHYRITAQGIDAHERSRV